MSNDVSPPSPMDAFIASSMDVLTRLTRVRPSYGRSRVEPWMPRADSLLVTVGVRGDLHGQVVFEFDPPTVTLFIRAMCGGMDISEEQDAMVLCEVANMIAGNALAEIEALGYEATITPPEAVRQDDLAPFPTAPVVLIPIENDHGGEMGVCVFIDESLSVYNA